VLYGYGQPSSSMNFCNRLSVQIFCFFPLICCTCRWPLLPGLDSAAVHGLYLASCALIIYLGLQFIIKYFWVWVCLVRILCVVVIVIWLTFRLLHIPLVWSNHFFDKQMFLCSAFLRRTRLECWRTWMPWRRCMIVWSRYPRTPRRTERPQYCLVYRYPDPRSSALIHMRECDVTFISAIANAPVFYFAADWNY